MENQNYSGNKVAQGKGPSWPVIIIVLILFWPVGIYLIAKKMSVDKQSALKSGKTIYTIGWVLLIMGIIAVIVGPSDQSQAVSGRITYFILFVGGGLAMVLIGGKSKVRAERFRKYITMIVNQNITSISSISTALNINYDTVDKDLQRMIDSGYFPGAYIDNNEKSIVLPNKNGTAINDPGINNDGIERSSMQMKAVVCKNCGANNQIKEGSAAECEYCGSPLNIK